MKSHLKTLITVVTTAAVTFSVTSIFYSINLRQDSKAGNTSALKSKLDIVNTYIEKNFLYDDVDYEKADTAAIKAYVDALDEPYTHYFTSDEFREYIGNVEESYIGIGVIVSADTENDKIVVVAPLADSPAYEAGLKPGDFILAVDGEAFTANDMDDCVKTIKGGTEGTKVKLTVERDGEKLDFEVLRKEIVENSVSSEMLDDGIGYISISSFNTNTKNTEETTYTEFVDAVKGLKSNGMEKMIIDLRDNPGGVLDVVCDIVDYILPEGIITYTETKNGDRKEYKSDKNELNIPIVVLINENSASSSEILAGALKDYDRAEIVGDVSFGKGIVQSVFPFSDGSGMSMTIAKYYTPNGTSIHGIGIEPDFKVSVPEKYKDGYVAEIPRDEDTQLKKAVEILNHK